MSLLKSIKQQLGLGPAAENHFWDGSVANKLKLFRGTPDAPGVEVLAVDAGSVSVKTRITGPGTVLAACIIDGSLAGVNAPIAGFGVTQVNRSATGTYILSLGASFPTSSFIVSALADNGALNQVLWNAASLNTVTLSNYVNGVLANCQRLFVTILRAD